MTTAMQKAEPSAVNIYEPRDMSEAMALAKHVSKSQLVPQAFQGKEADILVAMIWSKELGVSFMQGIQNIAVINGKPSIYGDLSMALLWQSGLAEQWDEKYEGSGDKLKAVITAKRDGVKTAMTKEFSLEEAKQAGLAGKDVWKKYTKDMLMWRARGRMFDALFADVMKGLILAEEAQDYPAPKGGTKPAPAPEPAPEQGEAPSVEEKPTITPIEHPTEEKKVEEKTGEGEAPPDGEPEVVDAEHSDEPADDEAPPEAADEEENTPSGQLKKALIAKRRYGWTVKGVEEKFGKTWDQLSAFELKEIADKMKEFKTNKEEVEWWLLVKAEHDAPLPQSTEAEPPEQEPATEDTQEEGEADGPINGDHPDFSKEMVIAEIDNLLKRIKDKGIDYEEELGIPATWNQTKYTITINELVALKDDLKDFLG